MLLQNYYILTTFMEFNVSTLFQILIFTDLHQAQGLHMQYTLVTQLPLIMASLIKCFILWFSETRPEIKVKEEGFYYEELFMVNK